MMRRLAIVLGMLAVVAPRQAEAQARGAEQLEVRTFRLQHATPEQAASVVGPYIVSPDGGVYGSEHGVVRTITVREAPRVLARIDSVLALLDQPPATVRLRFQLIAAQDEATRDPRIAVLDSTLRDLFRFQGYRLLAQTVVSVSEWSGFSQSFAADGDRLLLTGRINAVSAGADSGRVLLDVELSRPRALDPSSTVQSAPQGERVLSTGLSIPIGQTVVLGSGVVGESIQALILVVTPEVPAGSRRR